jgi:hypothetical protein
LVIQQSTETRVLCGLLEDAAALAEIAICIFPTLAVALPVMM